MLSKWYTSINILHKGGQIVIFRVDAQERGALDDSARQSIVKARYVVPINEYHAALTVGWSLAPLPALPSLPAPPVAA